MDFECGDCSITLHHWHEGSLVSQYFNDRDILTPEMRLIETILNQFLNQDCHMLIFNYMGFIFKKIRIFKNFAYTPIICTFYPEEEFTKLYKKCYLSSILEDF